MPRTDDDESDISDKARDDHYTNQSDACNYNNQLQDQLEAKTAAT